MKNIEKKYLTVPPRKKEMKESVPSFRKVMILTYNDEQI